MRRSKTSLLRLPNKQKCNSIKWCYIFYSLNITPPLCEMYSGGLRVFSFCNIAAVISFYVCSISRNISRSQIAKSTSPGMLYEMKFNEDTFWGRALIREGLRIGTRALNWRHYLIFLIFLRDSWVSEIREPAWSFFSLSSACHLFRGLWFTRALAYFARSAIAEENERLLLVHKKGCSV